MCVSDHFRSPLDGAACMIIDCHVHISATVAPHGSMSQRLLRSVPFKFMRWRLGLDPAGPAFDAELEGVLDKTISQASGLDAAVILAFDAVHDRDGRKHEANTHLYVTNDYVVEL